MSVRRLAGSELIAVRDAGAIEIEPCDDGRWALRLSGNRGLLSTWVAVTTVGVV